MNEIRACADDELLDRQRAAWARGERPSPESFTEGDTSANSHTKLLDLIYQEIVIREEMGETPRPDDYIAQFPSLVKDILIQFEVHAALRSEQEVTRHVADSQSTAETLTSISIRQDSTLAGYEILGTLGTGGMGSVFKARDRSLNRIVALKMIHPGRVPSERELRRFRTEAEAIARLRHPNIVRIHEVGEIDGTPYLSLELAEGGTLAGRLKDFPYKPRDAAELIKTLAMAIQHAHEQRIIHRDLKPANILFAEDGMPRIADFGLAKILGEGESNRDTTRTGEPIGTPRYMSPEQVAGNSDVIGESADIHALGLLLYECLTGRVPFIGSNAVRTMERIRDEEPIPPRRLVHGIPKDLQTICLRCLNKEPARRYSDAASLADDLGRFLRGETIKARPTTLLEKSWKWCRRNPSATLILAFALLIIGASTTQYVIRQRIEANRIEDLRSETIALIDEGRVALAAKDARTAQARFLEAWTKTRTEPTLIELSTAVAGWLDHARRDEERGTWGKQSGPRTFDDVRDEAYLLAMLGDKFAINARGDAFEHARSLMVENDAAWNFEREMSVIVEAGVLLASGDANGALTTLDRVSLVTSLGRLKRAECMDALKRPEDAEIERRIAKEMSPILVWESIERGITRFRQNKYQEAERAFDAALAIEPGLFSARLFQAVCFLKLNKPTEAKVGLTACVAQRPSFAWSYLFRSDALFALDEKAASQMELERLQSMKLSEALRDYLTTRSPAPYAVRPKQNEATEGDRK